MQPFQPDLTIPSDLVRPNVALSLGFKVAVLSKSVANIITLKVADAELVSIVCPILRLTGEVLSEFVSTCTMQRALRPWRGPYGTPVLCFLPLIKLTFITAGAKKRPFFARK